jgi:Flp pilus assembly protein TadD
VIADLTASYPDLAAPLRDLTGRQAFHALMPFALSGRGAIQRDALIQEISRIYHPEMVVMVEDVINGFLETTDGISRSLLEETTRTAPAEPISEPSRTNERPPVTPPSRSLKPQLTAIAGLLALWSAGTIGITSLISRHLSKPEKSCAQIASEAVPLPAESKEFQHLIEANKGRCSTEPDFLTQQAIATNYNGNHQEALQLIHKSITLNPGDGDAYYWEGKFYFDSKNYRMALASYEKALQINPKNENSHFMKGVTLTWLDDPAGAIAAFTKAIAIKQDPQYYRERAGSRLQTKDYSLALADANKAIQMNSKDGDAYRLRAYIKTWLDDFTGACSDIKEAKGLGIKRVPNGTGADVPIDQKVKEICP